MRGLSLVPNPHPNPSPKKGVAVPAGEGLKAKY